MHPSVTALKRFTFQVAGTLRRGPSLFKWILGLQWLDGADKRDSQNETRAGSGVLQMPILTTVLSLTAEVKRVIIVRWKHF